MSAKCGTRSGYNAHLRKREKACDSCKTANLEHVQTWTAANRQRWAEINRQARERYRNRPEVRERRRAESRQRFQGDEGKELGRLATSKRRALKMGNDHEPYTVAQVLERHGTDCHICHEPITLTISGRPGYQAGWERGLQLDHVVALVNGGTDALDNVKPAHAICNMRKQAS